MALNIDPVVDELLNFSDREPETAQISPIWSDNKLLDSPSAREKLAKFTKETHELMIDSTKQRANTQIKNLALWLGIHYKSQSKNADLRDSNLEDVTIDSHKVIVNNIYDIERNRYSKITRNIPKTRLVARTSDYDDYAGARVGQAVLATAKDITRQQKKCRKMVRESFLFGESWIKLFWDKDRGVIDPRWENKIKGMKSSETKEEVGSDGEKIIISPLNPIYIGNHAAKVVLPWWVFVHPVVDPEEAEWIILPEFIHCEVAKRLYPKFKNKIAAAEGARFFNTETLSVEYLKDHCLLYDVYGRSTKFLKDGIHYVQIGDEIVEKPDDNPLPNIEESEWGNLPVERLTDIDVPGRLHGYSTVQILSNLQHTENQMGTMIKHYLLLMAHPKFLLPREASVDVDELSDDSLRIYFSGGMAPTMMTPNPVSPQIVAFWEVIRERMQKLGDLHGVSSGDLPKNVRAAKAIRLLQEMEDLRATSIFNKYHDLFIAMDTKLVAQMTNYKKDDGRLSLILGDGNEYIADDFDVSIFGRSYSVKLEMSSMLPQQPSAKAEFILETWQLTNGQIFPPEKLVKLLGFDSEKEFIDHATVSVVKAQRENDYITKNKLSAVKPPTPFENNLVEWREHLVLTQSVQFQNLPEAAQEKAKTHVRGHEALMFVQMRTNPGFREYVYATQPLFPTILHLPENTGMPMAGGPGNGGQPPQGGTPGPQPPGGPGAVDPQQLMQLLAGGGQPPQGGVPA